MTSSPSPHLGALLSALVAGCGVASSATSSAAPPHEAPASHAAGTTTGSIAATDTEPTASGRWSTSFSELALALPPAPRGRLAVVQDGHPLVLVDEAHFVVATDEGVQRVLPGPAGLVASSPEPSLPVAGGAFLVEAREGLVAFDLETLTPRWTHALPSAIESRHLRSAGNAFIHATSQELFAIDPMDGRVLWRADVGNLQVARAGQGLVLVTDWDASAVVARDARTGDERFRVPMERPRVSPISPWGFAVTSAPSREGPRPGASVVVVDLGGEVQRRIVLDAPLTGEDGLAVGPDAVAMLVRPREDVMEVRRYELRSDRPPLRSPALGSPGVGGASVVITEAGVALEDATHLVRSLGSDLREVWLGQLAGGCSALQRWTPRPGAPGVLVCRGTGVTLLRSTTEPPVRRPVTAEGVVRCEGRPLPNAPVQIGGALVRTAADGTYRVETTVDGPSVIVAVPFAVWLDDARSCSYETRFVPLEERVLTQDFALSSQFGGALDGM